MNEQPVLIICMGVSSCGKTSVARTVANGTGLKFFEADDFHGEENRAHMAAGKALDDAMREPWIDRICTALEAEHAAGKGCVLACSALRKAHRDRFRQLGFRMLFLFLDGSPELIARWISERTGHFMPPELLDSQFADLESPLLEPDVRRIELGDDWSRITTEAMSYSRKCLAR